MVRCDDDARELNWGLWVVERPGGFRTSWVGRKEGGLLGKEFHKDAIIDDLWIRDDWTRKYEIEKDVS